MKNLYVAGDSYCFYRSDPEAHWPAVLASKLNLNLKGAGFPGLGWWPVRQHLIEYIASPDFSSTDIFVLCHTNPLRWLSHKPISNWDDYPLVKKVYETYLESSAVSDWCARNWYRECNDLLCGKTVVHLQSFGHEAFAVLKGILVDVPLLDFAVTQAGGNMNLADYGDPKILKHMSEANNHLSPQANIKLAEIILQKLDHR